MNHHIVKSVSFLFILLVILYFLGCEGNSQDLEMKDEATHKIAFDHDIGKISGLCISEDEYYLAVSTSDGIIYIKELHSNQLVKKLNGFRSISQCKFSKDGKYFAVLDFEKLHIYKSPSFERIFSFKGNTGDSYCFEFDIDPDKIFIGGSDRESISMADQVKGQVSYWDLAKRKKISTRSDFADMISTIRISNDGSKLLVLNMYEISIIDLTNPKQVKRIRTDDIEFQSADFYNSGFDIIVGTGQNRGYSGELKTKNLSSNTPFNEIVFKESSWYSYVKSVEDLGIIVCIRDMSRGEETDAIEIRSIYDGKLIGSIPLNVDKETTILLSSGKFIARINNPTTIELFEIKNFITAERSK